MKKAGASYPIRAASKLTGISIDTLRAWERRYEAVVPSRTARGRVYDEGQIHRLTLLRDALAAGYAIGQAAQLSDEQLEALVKTAADATQTMSQAAGVPPRVLLETVVGAIEAFDAYAADRELGRLAATLTIPDLIHEVVLPLMELVGERWHNGSFNVAQEHMTSGILRNLLGSLIRQYQPARPATTLLFATPPGELHEFGILAAAMLAVSAGYEVLYLGPNLPAREIVSAATLVSAAVVILGIVALAPGEGLTGTLRAVAAGLPQSTEIWLGGRGAQGSVGGIRSGRMLILDDFHALTASLERLKQARS